MSRSGFDRNLTVFSPEGRLYQIEYAIKATKSEGLTTIGIRGEDSACIVTQKKLPDRLCDPASITHLQTISPHVGCCVIGFPGDCRNLVRRVQYNSAKFTLKYGYEMPPSQTAKNCADFQQNCTQMHYGRPPAAMLMFIGWDDVDGPQIWRSDPAGTVAEFYGCAAGEKEQEAFNQLEKRKIDGKMKLEDVVCNAILCLQSVTASEFKPQDIEIAIVTKDNTKVRALKEEEIEMYLNLVSERD